MEEIKVYDTTADKIKLASWKLGIPEAELVDMLTIYIGTITEQYNGYGLHRLAILRKYM